MRLIFKVSFAVFISFFIGNLKAYAQPVKPVSPGTVVVHVNGALYFDFGDINSTFNKVTSASGTDKLSPISTNGDFRLYPGFDAQTLNGIDYGAQVELHTAFSDAGVGAQKTSGTGNTAGIEGLYIKRAYGYIGTIPAGFLRFGQTDSAWSLLQAGVIEAFGDGAQFNGADGGVIGQATKNSVPGLFVYGDFAALFTTDKVVYISPALAGFVFSGGYEPNSNGLKEGDGNCPVAGSACAALSSSPVAGDIGSRRKNTVDAAISYSGGNEINYKASVGYLHGAPINFTGPETAVGTATRDGFDDLSVYQVGGQATFRGLTVGANVKGGQLQDNYTFKPRGGRNALGYIVGATYVVGPVVLGGNYFNEQSAGAFIPGGKAVERTLSEYGVTTAVNYVLSPALTFYVQYMYGHRHQVGNTSLNSNGNAQVQVLSIGSIMKW
jgi:hypothetical protein